MMNVGSKLRSAPAVSFLRSSPASSAPQPRLRTFALPPAQPRPQGPEGLPQPAAAGWSLRPGVKLPLERQLAALEGTEAYQALVATPEFAAYTAALVSDPEAHLGKNTATLIEAFAALCVTEAYKTFRNCRQARALRDTLSRCKAEGCTSEQQRLLDTSVTLSLFEHDDFIRLVTDPNAE